MTPHERLLETILSSRVVEDLLRPTISLLVEVSAMDVGVIRVADGGTSPPELRSRASVGLEDEVDAGFTSPGEDVDSSAGGRLLRLSMEDGRVSDEMRRTGVCAAYWLGIPRDPLPLGVCLGCRSADDVDTERASLLVSLATHAAAAMGRLRAFGASERTISEREQMLADVAHDLKNSLHSVMLSSAVLEQQLEPVSPLRATVHRIARNTRHAAAVVETLLSSSVIEAGKLVLREAAFDPAELVLSAAELQQDAGLNAGVVITTDISPGLPRVRGDRERLLEVFDNLVGNALKFTAAGGSISLGAAPRQGTVLFWVQDTGAGMLPEEVTRIFERYWRAKRGARKGSGLGLSICKGIVEAHGGRIWAESRPGQGTTMLFTLPMVEAQVVGEPSGVANVLLVDDRSANLHALEAILSNEKYKIFKATSGQEALRVALQEELSVVLLDIEMPEMSGLEIASHLKLTKRTKSIPVLFITAYGEDPEQIYRAYAAGGADYLVKPLDPEIVRRKVAVFAELGRRRARRAADSPSPHDYP